LYGSDSLITKGNNMDIRNLVNHERAYLIEMKWISGGKEFTEFATLNYGRNCPGFEDLVCRPSVKNSRNTLPAELTTICKSAIPWDQTDGKIVAVYVIVNPNGPTTVPAVECSKDDTGLRELHIKMIPLLAFDEEGKPIEHPKFKQAAEKFQEQHPQEKFFQ